MWSSTPKKKTTTTTTDADDSDESVDALISNINKKQEATEETK
jgi:hypothetical protein